MGEGGNKGFTGDGERIGVEGRDDALSADGLLIVIFFPGDGRFSDATAELKDFPGVLGEEGGCGVGDLGLGASDAVDHARDEFLLGEGVGFDGLTDTVEGEHADGGSLAAAGEDEVGGINGIEGYMVSHVSFGG